MVREGGVYCLTVVILIMCLFVLLEDTFIPNCLCPPRDRGSPTGVGQSDKGNCADDGVLVGLGKVGVDSNP